MGLETIFTNSANFKCLENLRPDYVDFYLNSCGTENCEPGYGYGPHTRTDYIIHVVTKGKGMFQVNGNTFPISENQAFLITPGIATYYEADQKEPWFYGWIGFNGLKAYECVNNAGFTEENPTITLDCTEELIYCIQEMLAAHQLTYFNELKRNGLLMRFMAAMIEDTSPKNSQRISYDYPGDIYVKQAVDYLSKNFSHRLKINHLADYIGINRSYLTNSFKKSVGLSPQEFLVNLRMNKAVSLLKETALPISTISIQVGYDDPLAFSKIFKQKYGVSPRAYRESPEQLVLQDCKRTVFKPPSL